jgi:uncharacterized protein (UPF0333 family)
LKGQVSFESLLLLLVIISSTIFITNLFIQTNDVTNAYNLIRSEFLIQTNSLSENMILEKVYFVNEERPTFYIKTINDDITKIDLTKIEEKVNANTNFENVLIKKE